MLGRFGFQFLSRSQKRNVGQMNNQTVFTQFPLQLTYTLNERQRFNITNRSSNLSNYKVIIAFIAQNLNISFDFVGDMRDYLHGFTQEVAPAFFVYHILINPSGSDIIGTVSFNVEKSFVVSEIQIGLVPIHRHVTFTMFIWVQCSGIDIDVWIKFLVSHPEAACLKQFAQRSSYNPFT